MINAAIWHNCHVTAEVIPNTLDSVDPVKYLLGKV